MRSLYIDIETYSSVDLKECGVYKYAQSPDFEILLFGYAFDEAPVCVIDMTGKTRPFQGLPDDLLKALKDPEIVKIAYNANFERVCLNAVLVPAEQWECLAVTAAELGLPKILEKVLEVTGQPEDKQKLKAGKGLINYFCRPHERRRPENALTLFSASERMRPEDDPARWQKFIEYNRRDVEAERALRKSLARFFIPETERRLWALDQRINDRGVGADLAMADNAVIMNAALKAELREKAKALMGAGGRSAASGLDNPGSIPQIKKWIKQETGVDIPSLKKDRLEAVKSELNNENVKKFLELRAGLAKTSIGKYGAILRAACADGRLRGLTQFYGANRTGRWAGRLVQLQNLPAAYAEDSHLARELVQKGSRELLEALYGEPTEVLAALIRSAFIPQAGYRFVCADFKAIEARVLAWLAGEAWRLQVFKSKGKIYEASAERMFNLPAASVKKGDAVRQKGKIAELALGYGGGTGALKKMGALGMGLKEDELQPLAASWRDANPNIVKFWHCTEEEARRAISGKPEPLLKRLTGTETAFYKDGPLLRVKLPSGRSLSYVSPKLKAVPAGGGRQPGLRIMYSGIIKSGGWGEQETYGAKLVENLVQAIARDCLAAALTEIEEAGWPVVFHVHDEIICEVPESEAEKALAAMLEIMARPLRWAPGLPLAAEGFICDFYRKG
jgi:DNA polymerase